VAGAKATAATRSWNFRCLGLGDLPLGIRINIAQDRTDPAEAAKSIRRNVGDVCPMIIPFYESSSSLCLALCVSPFRSYDNNSVPARVATTCCKPSRADDIHLARERERERDLARASFLIFCSSKILCEISDSLQRSCPNEENERKPLYRSEIEGKDWTRFKISFRLLLRSRCRLIGEDRDEIDRTTRTHGKSN